MDAELLITEIKKWPRLWDVWHEQYKDKQKKNEGWLHIAATIVKDYSTKTEAEKKMIVQEIISKWRSIRDNYVRSIKKQIQNIKSGGSGKKIPRYIYEDQLSFLKRNTEQRLAGNGGTKEEEAEEEQNDEETENSDAVSVEVATSAAEKPNRVALAISNAKRRKLNNFTSSSAKRLKRGGGGGGGDGGGSGGSSSSSRSRSVGQKLVALLDSTRANSASASDADDEDLTFYKSTLSLVKTLNVDQKLQFRIQVMQILRAIKQADVAPSRNSASPTPGSSTYGPHHHYYNLYPENHQSRLLYATPPPPASPQSASSNSRQSLNLNLNLHSPPAAELIVNHQSVVSRRSKSASRTKVRSPSPGGDFAA